MPENTLTEQQIARIDEIILKLVHLLRHDFVDRINNAPNGNFEIMRDIPELLEWVNELSSFDPLYTEDQRSKLKRSVDDLQTGINQYLDILRQAIDERNRSGGVIDETPYIFRANHQQKAFVDRFVSNSSAFLRSLRNQETRSLRNQETYEAGTEFDIFFSYSTANEDIATDLTNRMRGLNLRVFLSHDTIRVGKWKEQVIRGLKGSRIAVVLMSEESLNSEWVKYEIGALWALGRVIAPALLNVSPEHVPEIISAEFQAMNVATKVERADFVHEVDKFLKRLGNKDRS